MCSVEQQKLRLPEDHEPVDITGMCIESADTLLLADLDNNCVKRLHIPAEQPNATNETANKTANETANETANKTANKNANEIANETAKETANKTANETAVNNSKTPALTRVFNTDGWMVSCVALVRDSQGRLLAATELKDLDGRVELVRMNENGTFHGECTAIALGDRVLRVCLSFNCKVYIFTSFLVYFTSTRSLLASKVA